MDYTAIRNGNQKMYNLVMEYIMGFDNHNGVLNDFTELIIGDPYSVDPQLVDLNQQFDGDEDQELLDDLYNEFIDRYFDNWEDSLESMYVLHGLKLNAHELINLYILSCQWYKKQYNKIAQTDNKTEEDIFNFIACWYIKINAEGQGLDTLIKDKIQEALYTLSHNNYLKKRVWESESRLRCVVCLEKKIIYTCCSQCNSCMLCKACYDCIDNKCPLCRTPNMISNNYLDYIPMDHRYSYNNVMQLINPTNTDSEREPY